MTKKLFASTFAVPLSGNKGSTSMLLGLKDAFESSNIPLFLEVFSYYPIHDSKIAAEDPNITVHAGHPKHIAFQIIPSILLNKISSKLVPLAFKRYVDSLAKSDVILLIGGTTFADSMLFKVPWNILAALPGYLMGKKTIFLSQTMGPFNKILNRISAEWALKRATAIHGRGKISTKNVRQLGFSQCEYRPDLSFTMNIPSIKEACILNKEISDLMYLISQKNKLPVGIAPNSIVYNKAKSVGIDYIDFIANVIRVVSYKGYQPILIPHSYLKDSVSYHNNDRGLCFEIIKRSELKEVLFLDADLPASVLRTLIGQMHILVASRFHSMISALSMGVPPITFGWGDQKYIEVLSEFDVENLFCSYRAMNNDSFQRLFDETIANRDEIVDKIVSKKTSIEKEAFRIPEIILKCIEEFPK